VAPRLIMPLPGNERLADSVAKAGSWEIGRVEVHLFPDQESNVRLASDVRGRPVYLLCSLDRPDAKFLRLMFAADTARELGATEVNLVAPYLAYMRQDRRFREGEAITSKTFARLLSTGIDRLICVDPHLHRYRSLSALYPLPTQIVHAADALAAWIAANVRRPLIVGPDEESTQWVSAVAALARAPYAVSKKHRRGDRDVEVILPDLSQFRDRRPVLVDDIASSGRTLVESALGLRRQKLPRPVCVLVHAVFAAGAWEKLAELAERIVSTDTIFHPTNEISVGSALAEALSSTLAERHE
jgi:ribose-phosphate pyrophosphokinase